jgi:hypothetical protein
MSYYKIKCLNLNYDVQAQIVDNRYLSHTLSKIAHAREKQNRGLPDFEDFVAKQYSSVRAAAS